MMPSKIFITGIGTGIGKTIVSAILCEAMQADYWKPIQAGSLENTDSDIVKSLLTNTESVAHPEAYKFTTACSPHLAAKIDGVEISLDQITAPKTTSALIIEGAGGILVPLTDKYQVVHVIGQLNAPVVIVSKNYLGSINHTLLTIEALRARAIDIIGIVFNGAKNIETEKIIHNFSDLPVIGHVPEETLINKEVIATHAQSFRRRLDELC